MFSLGADSFSVSFAISLLVLQLKIVDDKKGNAIPAFIPNWINALLDLFFCMTYHVLLMSKINKSGHPKVLVS